MGCTQRGVEGIVGQPVPLAVPEVFIGGVQLPGAGRLEALECAREGWHLDAGRPGEVGALWIRRQRGRHLVSGQQTPLDQRRQRDQ